ncbi:MULTISPECIES: tail fiber domain-containing protein [Providencia]|uniref:tail fiber/spike domain-containing protein n=1 Tax=Providencia TaxID=586 RepID=UPI001419D1F1|nr:MULTISPECIES: tail fiber domain-containing protein [Providencia]NIA45623.1 tail fiber domain-containing protein [Providencia rettgeri]NIA99202.1 tail fiber domain-containing protein [Providencia rettgeri]NIB16994.1 tail fiber domain-containing protein [Providencia rettgeri]NIB36915.1 tail fiber domain-containing protein [Providencia rettgeri]NIL73008.1 tail fiber domain-containing protein [Providencia sp. 504mA]
MREVKPTQKPVPSSDIKDLFFNSGLLDIWATSLERKYIDRFGNCHLTAAGMEWLFKELVEKFKVDMNIAIVAAGYITIDSFQQGADLPNNELTQRNHILRDETTGEYYRWDGDLPKQVPAGSTPQSTGGIGKGAWVGVGDASLRSDLMTGGTEIVKDKEGKNLEQRFNDAEKKAKEGKYRTLSSVRLFAELPLQPEGYQDLINEYHYQYIYPQGLCFFDDDNELYINCSGVGGSNDWSWIYVYDRNSMALKSIFSAGNTNAEGLYVTRIEGQKYLFILESYSGSGNGTTGVYKLPDQAQEINQQRLTAYRVCQTGQYFQLGGLNNQLVIEINTGTSATQAVQRRTKFNYFDAIDLITNDEPRPIGAVSVGVNLERVGKRQGVTLTPDGLIMGYGSYIPYGTQPEATHVYAFRMASFTGREIKSFTADPNNVCDVLNPHLRNKATRMENEGVAYSEFNGVGRLFSLNITGNSTQQGESVGGLLVLEQNVSPFDEGVIDIADTASLMGCIDENNDTTIQLQDRPFDRLQNKRLETLEQILDRMNRDSQQTYRFYNGYAPFVKDINGDEITPSCSVTIENMNSYTYVVTVSGNRTFYQMLITGDRGGPYTQRMGTFIQSPETTPRPEFLKRHSRVMGVDGSISENIYTNSSGSSTISRFYTGDNTNPQLSGSIITNGANKTTSFNTTSDERLKDDGGEYSDGLNKIKGIKENSAIRKFKFKGSDIEQYGFFAQRLEKVIPSAVSYDESTDTYLVSLASLVPDLVSAVIELSEEINKLKSKVS